ncbi:MAG: GFA family protein [Casimicrobiaceae bacterium]
MTTLATPTLARGSCQCGRVRLVARFPSRFCTHCHCESCRRSHSAGFVTWVGFASDQVQVEAGTEQLVDYESSPRTFRSFCNVCGTKVLFRSERWPGETHIPLAAITTAIDREAEGHYRYEEHVAWIPWPEAPAPT